MDALGRHRGFTLMELLTVILIIGMCVGLASAIVRPDDREILRVEAERLAKLLELAMEESQLSGKAIAWTVDKSGAGYRFWRLSTDNEWRVINNNEWVRARTLPKNMVIASLDIESTVTRGEMRLEFLPDSVPLSFSIHMTLGNARHSVSASPIGELRVLADGQ